MPQNPFGSGVTSSLPKRTNNTVNGSTGSAASLPANPIDDLLVADSVSSNQVDVDGTKGWQLDVSPPSNRISISVQNNGPNDVEIFPNTASPSFGNGWLIKSGGWFEFNWTEAIKTYARCASGNTADLRIFQNVKQG